MRDTHTAIFAALLKFGDDKEEEEDERIKKENRV